MVGGLGHVGMVQGDGDVRLGLLDGADRSLGAQQPQPGQHGAALFRGFVGIGLSLVGDLRPEGITEPGLWRLAGAGKAEYGDQQQDPHRSVSFECSHGVSLAVFLGIIREIGGQR